MVKFALYHQHRWHDEPLSEPNLGLNHQAMLKLVLGCVIQKEYETVIYVDDLTEDDDFNRHGCEIRATANFTAERFDYDYVFLTGIGENQFDDSWLEGNGSETHYTLEEPQYKPLFFTFGQFHKAHGNRQAISGSVDETSPSLPSNTGIDKEQADHLPTVYLGEFTYITGPKFPELLDNVQRLPSWGASNTKPYIPASHSRAYPGRGLKIAIVHEGLEDGQMVMESYWKVRRECPGADVQIFASTAINNPRWQLPGFHSLNAYQFFKREYDLAITNTAVSHGARSTGWNQLRADHEAEQDKGYFTPYIIHQDDIGNFMKFLYPQRIGYVPKVEPYAFQPSANAGAATSEFLILLIIIVVVIIIVFVILRMVAARRSYPPRSIE